ncbi:hypothetical protein J8273_7960 [Carpediemonas membranifera]|uniref:Uncharacterized protein n=1 Tax=Carpediemonas membranifera TaxID=201153 RepID=A0A8J6DXN4_9EUKA|nr:hypothetical protein J8273_7960 [Carpediemonas membranifera]|eukprot:KAG9390609.1 hypothetical protein J8273_7960 [Carpediemonas membranifera]
MAEETQQITRDVMISAYRLAVSVTDHISGNIPSLLAVAYSRHFGVAIGDGSGIEEYGDIRSLLAILTRPLPLCASARVLIDRARSILIDGPTLSMNVELAEGEELPDALHTLLQGTIWACFLTAGASPIDSPRPAALWFLCRKTLFTATAALDGALPVFVMPGSAVPADLRCYSGRLFQGRSRVPVPPVHKLYHGFGTTLAVTAAGPWGWGANGWFALGLGHGGPTPPGPLVFTDAPEAENTLDSLGPWQQRALVVDAFIGHRETVLVTLAGVLVAGSNQHGRLGFRRFLTVPSWLLLPLRLRPCNVVSSKHAVALLTPGRAAFVAGDNSFGALGLGHTRPVVGFSRIPTPVDAVALLGRGIMLLSAGRVLFAGRASPVCRALAGFEIGEVVVAPVALPLPHPVDAIVSDQDRVVCLTMGGVTLGAHECQGSAVSWAVGDRVTAARGKGGVTVTGASGQAWNGTSHGIVQSIPALEQA